MDTAQTWLNRATLYEVLSLAFLPTTPVVAGALVAGEFAEACAEVALANGLSDGVRSSMGAALGSYRGASSEAVFHALRQEYTRLFVGTREPLITPYAGVRAANARGRRGLLFVGTESMAIERTMRACGIAHAQGAPNEPLDHMGSLCEFMSYLCLACAGSVALPESAGDPVEVYRAFYEEHFAPFARWFAPEVASLSGCTFYQAMASMLEAWVRA